MTMEETLDERQRRIYERLKKAGDGPAAFFLDACRLMTIEPSLVTTTHLVGHCIREIESALRKLLVPLGRDPLQLTPNELVTEIDDVLAAAGVADHDPRAIRWRDIAQDKGGETQKAQIKMILSAVGIAHSDDIAVNWLRLAGTKKELGLRERAHRTGLSVRPLDEEFREFWSQIQSVFDAVLERFEARYLTYIEILKRLLTKDVPEKEDVKTLKEAIPRTVVTYRFFFEQLAAPGWFVRLRSEGFFTSPFPWYWPQAVYLRKIAPALPQEVLNVMLSVVTDGLWTHVEFATAAKELPPDLAARWARHEAAWIQPQRQLGWPLPQKYADVIIMLLHAGENDAAAELLQSVLSNPVGVETTSVFDEPPSRMEWHAVQHFMEQVVPPFVEHAPLLAFETFADLLASILEQGHDDLAGVYDGSTLWRESITRDRGLHVGRRNELVTAVRTSAVAAVRAEAASANDIVTRLRARKLAIFERLALFILSQFPAATADLVATELFSDPERLREDFDRGEFGLVVAAGFPHLATRDRDRIADLIRSGPDVNAFREGAEARGFTITDAHVRRYVLHWQTRFVERIIEHAPDELRERYASWKRELANVTATLEPAPATRTLDQLREMQPAEVITHFRTIELPQRLGHSRFDLGRDLERTVATAPVEFSRVAREACELEPYLIHWYFYGLSQAVNQQHDALDWSSIADLLEYVVAQPLEPAKAFENSWAAARKSAASLLDRAFAVDEPTVTREVAPRLWSVLTELLERDPGDEAVEVADSLAKTGSQAVTQAANSTRGEAFDAACRLALWMRQTDASALQPELTMLLDSILGPNGSLAIRAALGKNFLHILDLERTWITENLDRVLPRGDDQILGWCATWSGFLSRWRPSREEFEWLREHYGLAIRRLVPGAPEHSFVAQAIATHLMDEYWSGFLDLDDPLMKEFFALAAGRLRGHALWYVLRGFDELKETLPTDVRERITALWTWRVAAAADQDDRSDELSWYGFFFAIGRFDEDWSVETLRAVLALGVRVDHHEIIERLAVYSTKNADLAFECYRRLIALDEHRFLIDEASGRQIVQNALRSPVSAESARGFVNKLASEGQFHFADLV
jgi:hypothetical protein